MKIRRRKFLTGAACSLLSKPALAWFPHGSSSAAPGLNITWVNGDGTWASAPAGWTVVRNQFTTNMAAWFSNPVTLVIDIGYGTMGGSPVGGGSASSASTYATPSYASTKAAMLAVPTYASATLPSSVSGTFMTTSPLGQALGLNGPAPGGIDAYAGFNSGISWDLHTDGSCAGGLKSLIGDMFHEITETMGRQYYESGYTTSQSLFSFTSAGVRSVVQSDARYFSDDNGTTNLGAYRYYSGSGGGDPGDWVGLSDCCNFSVATGTSGVPTQRDMRIMAAMGWNLTAAGRAMAGI